MSNRKRSFGLQFDQGIYDVRICQCGDDRGKNMKAMKKM